MQGSAKSLLEYFSLGFLFAAAGCWTIAVRRLCAGRPLLTYETRRPVPWGLLDIMLAILSLMIFQSAAAMFFSPSSPEAVPALSERVAKTCALAVAELLAVVLSVFLVRLRTQTRVADLGWDPRSLGRDLRLGVIAYVMLAPPVYGLQRLLTYWFPSKHPLIEMIREQPEPLILLATGFTAVIVAPLAEEYFFRVLVQGWCERLAGLRTHWRRLITGDEIWDEPLADAPDDLDEDASSSVALQSRAAPLWPIAISAGLFAGMHAQHGPDPIPLFLLAAGLGFVYQRTHRILPCIVVHFLLNVSSLVILLVELFSA